MPKTVISQRDFCYTATCLAPLVSVTLLPWHWDETISLENQVSEAESHRDTPNLQGT